MRNVNLNVAGVTFSIRSDGDPQYIESLASELAAKFQALRKGKPRVDQDLKLMTMVALGLLDEVHSTRANLEVDREESHRLASALLAQIDAILMNGQVQPSSE
ncbi:MAG: cell division protein ZapA [Myxococcota bacterium]|jgi:cell division protein ZapA (FtsZ GTPase activity inhibitor)|nr:cell division protein ZapA [Myxococcota bacterium]